jgi:hypothetical protein
LAREVILTRGHGDALEVTVQEVRRVGPCLRTMCATGIIVD